MSLNADDFPNHWRIVPIDHVAFFQEGPGVRTHQYTKSGVKLLNGSNINGGSLDLSKTDRYISEAEAFGKYKHFLVESGDLLIACSGVVVDKFEGKIAYAEEEHLPLCMNTSTMRFRSLNEDVLHLDYFRRFLQTSFFKTQLQKLITGSAQLNFGPSHIKQMVVPLPPLPEQKRIAAILDKADAIRRKRQQAIQLTDDFLRAVFLDMFGDPVTNPKGWAVRPVGDLCDCIVPGRDKPKSFNGSTPWITTNELIHLGVTIKKENYIGLTVDEILEVRARVVPKKSVIMTCVGDLGVISVAGEDMVINQQLHAFLPSEEITPSYLSFSLASQKGYMLKMASSTTLPYMNKAVCNSVPVMLPPKEMQDKFESLVAKVAVFKLKSSDFSYEAAFESISQNAFSGQL